MPELSYEKQALLMYALGAASCVFRRDGMNELAERIFNLTFKLMAMDLTEPEKEAGQSPGRHECGGDALMALGAGKYDLVCTLAREETQAEGLLLIVFNGKFGNGFSAQLAPDQLATVPDILRRVAADIEASVAEA